MYICLKTALVICLKCYTRITFLTNDYYFVYPYKKINTACITLLETAYRITILYMGNRFRNENRKRIRRMVGTPTRHTL